MGKGGETLARDGRDLGRCPGGVRAVLAGVGPAGVQLNLLRKVAHLPSAGHEEGLIIGFDFVD